VNGTLAGLCKAQYKGFCVNDAILTNLCWISSAGYNKLVDYPESAAEEKYYTIVDP